MIRRIAFYFTVLFVLVVLLGLFVVEVDIFVAVARWLGADI